MEQKKRNRGDNWTAEDKALLQELVRERVDIIENKNTDTNSNKSKQEAWRDLQESFNEICATKRTVIQLKSQWTIAKMTAKKAKSKERRELLKTGGGAQSVAEPLSNEDISVWLPNEFVVDFNSFDSDKSQQVVVLEESLPIQNSAELEGCEKSNIEADAVEVMQETDIVGSSQHNVENIKTPSLNTSRASKNERFIHIELAIRLNHILACV
ncbi:PREDICTED: uncharacterized protein LOC108358256 [Rhagoletis zephyria]|uniref:uncharacterized protein LOC108358256 n=1 Tax=Rhagoletis zephyria TaxID=28612 RepID=UPI0008114109|nr:PREDICTED: uncharacterized protein LOC108358256 [Rhagoletis zephyria]